MSTAFFTPLDATHTRLHVEIAYRLRVPGAWLAPVLRRVAARVLREDAEILARQTENLQRFAGPAYASTELDAFSGEIKRLLDQAEHDSGRDDVSQREIEIMM